MSAARDLVRKYLSLTPEQKSHISIVLKDGKTIKVSDVESSKMDINTLAILTILEPHKSYQVAMTKMQVPQKYQKCNIPDYIDFADFNNFQDTIIFYIYAKGRPQTTIECYSRIWLEKVLGKQPSIRIWGPGADKSPYQRVYKLPISGLWVDALTFKFITVARGIFLFQRGIYPVGSTISTSSEAAESVSVYSGIPVPEQYILDNLGKSDFSDLVPSIDSKFDYLKDDNEASLKSVKVIPFDTKSGNLKDMTIMSGYNNFVLKADVLYPVAYKPNLSVFSNKYNCSMEAINFGEGDVLFDRTFNQLYCFGVIEKELFSKAKYIIQPNRLLAWFYTPDYVKVFELDGKTIAIPLYVFSTTMAIIPIYEIAGGKHMHTLVPFSRRGFRNSKTMEAFDLLASRPGPYEPKIFPYDTTITELKRLYKDYYTGETSTDVLNRLKTNSFDKSILIYNIDTLGLEACKFSDIISRRGDKTPLEIFYDSVQEYVLMGFPTLVASDVDLFPVQRSKMIEMLKNETSETLRESAFNRTCIDLLSANIL